MTETPLERRVTPVPEPRWYRPPRFSQEDDTFESWLLTTALVYVPAHELVVTFDGDAEYVSLVCNQEGADRPCAVIDCPVDHEDVNRACINEHGAIALDECWAVSWMDNGGRETLGADALGPVRIPVIVEWDEGVVVRPA